MLPSNRLLCVTKLLIDLMIKSKCSTMVKKGNTAPNRIFELEGNAWYCSCKFSVFSVLISQKLNAAAVGAYSELICRI